MLFYLQMQALSFLYPHPRENIRELAVHVYDYPYRQLYGQVTQAIVQVERVSPEDWDNPIASTHWIDRGLQITLAIFSKYQIFFHALP